MPSNSKPDRRKFISTSAKVAAVGTIGSSMIPKPVLAITIVITTN